MTLEELGSKNRMDSSWRAHSAVACFRRNGNVTGFPNVREFVGCYAQFEGGLPCLLGLSGSPMGTLALKEEEYVRMHTAFYTTPQGQSELERMPFLVQVATIFVSARQT